MLFHLLSCTDEFGVWRIKPNTMFWPKHKRSNWKRIHKTMKLALRASLWYRVLTVGRDAIRLAWLRVSGVGLLHSCAVLRLSVRCHVLWRRSGKNMRIRSAIGGSRSKRKEEHDTHSFPHKDLKCEPFLIDFYFYKSYWFPFKASD